MKKETVFIHTEFIKLEQLLKLAGVVETGGQAKEEIAVGGILVNGEEEMRRGRKLRPGDTVMFGDICFLVEAEG